MRELLAQVLLLMRGEVDDEQPPAGPQACARLRAARARDRRGSAAPDGRRRDRRRRARPAARRCRPGAACTLRRPLCAMRARAKREHRRALVDADRAIGERGEQFQHAAGAGAEVEQRADALPSRHREDRRLDPLLRRMQRANAIPVGGAFGEIGGGLLAPRFARRVRAARDRIAASDRRAICGRRDRARARRPDRRGGKTPRRPRAGAPRARRRQAA